MEKGWGETAGNITEGHFWLYKTQQVGKSKMRRKRWDGKCRKEIKVTGLLLNVER